ncbi:MAG TPA: hypothetical protein VE842_04530 [Pyrinomonadaceae bacterium]|jgi:hypothetical protein|nr:hypothetical protein [Pyrinomonadaceae bacterium]
MIIKALIPASLLLLLLLSTGGALAAPSGVGQTRGALPRGFASLAAQVQKREGHTTSVWSHSHDGVKVEVRIEGEVDFTDDYTDIRSVSEDGSFQATDERGGSARRLSVTLDADGQLRRKYSVDGRKREFDAEARRWLSEFLLTVVREGGMDAKVRVRRLLEQRGARGVLYEISFIKTDYARRIYFDALISEGHLDAATLESVLRQAARQISGDYELAVFLIEHADRYLGTDATMPVFFEATKKIGSDYEHHRVLSAAVKAQPSRRALARMLESAAVIGSDYEKASFLIEAASLYMDDAGLRSAFLQTVNSIGSDYERGRVLAAVSKKLQLGSTLD